MTVRTVQKKRSRADSRDASEKAEVKDEDHPIADFHWLIKLMMSHRRATILAILFSIIAGVTSAASPYVIGIIIDHVREGVSLDQLLIDAAILIGVSIVTVGAFLVMRYYSGQVAFTTNYDIRRDLFDNLLTLEQRFFNQYPTGDLISRMHSDVEMVLRMMLIALTQGGSAFFTLMMTFVFLTTIDVPLTILAFVILSISTLFQIRAGKVLTPMFEKVQDQAGVVSALVQDSASGIQTIKTAAAETGVAAKFLEENKEFRRRWLYFKRRNEPIGLLPNMISETTAGVVLLVGGLRTIDGAMTIGNFAQFLIYLNVVSIGLLHLGMIYQRFQQTRGALQRLTPLMQNTTIHNAPNPKPLQRPRGEIKFENVGVQLDGEWILQDISLHIPSGSTVALVGATGCGKTMLVNLLARVQDPTTGNVMVDGMDVRKITLEDLRDASAYVPQSTFLFSQELHKNIRMGDNHLSEHDLDQALHIARVSNDLSQLPQGIDTMVGERGVMLSGGQKQRVAIARAIIRDPAILVLDDALSSVDTHTAADILADLRKILRSRTSIIIAHRIATVKDADFIVVMDKGRIVEQGTHDELIAQDGLYTRMVERELKEEDRDMVIAGNHASSKEVRS